MKLTAPKKTTFWISVGIAALGLIGEVLKVIALLPRGILDYLPMALIWIAYIVLILGVMAEGKPSA